MSIATLKKKTSSLYNSQSVGHTGFSINGTRRSQGWVGQTSLSRSLPRTLARGNTVCGHGGLYGSYNTNNGHSITSGLVDWNNNSVVKPTVGNPLEMMEIRNRCLRRFDCRRFKPVVKNNSGDQSDHTKKLADCALVVSKTLETDQVKKKKCANLDAKYMNPSYTNINTAPTLCGVTKNTDKSIMTEGVYTNNLTSKCIKNLYEAYPVGYKCCSLPGK